MRTVALISQKGGAGKSTLARQLAVIAGEAGPSYLIDRDPQATARKWWERRQDAPEPPAWPELLNLGSTSLTAAVERLKPKPGTLIIDTRPAVTEPEAEAARCADIVLVPVRPSPDDIEAVGDTLAMLRRLDRRALLIVNAAKTERRGTEARAALGRFGAFVCPQHVTDRAVFQDAALDGRGVGELRGPAAVAADAELRRVWQWVEETAANV